MNIKEAREFIDRGFIDITTDSPYMQGKADGFLEGYEQAAKAVERLLDNHGQLRKALHDLIEEVKIADNAHAYDFLIPAIQALSSSAEIVAKYKKEVGE